jgi:predicted PurR-regulated permease PerM
MAEQRRATSGIAIALWIVAAVAVLFFLRTAKSLLIPIALAFLTSYALEPVVVWLERHRLPRVAGATIVMLTILGATAGAVYGLRDDAVQLVQAVPKAAERARQMVQSQLGSAADAIQKPTKGAGTSGSSSSQSGGEGEGLSGTTGQAGSLLQRAVSGVFALAGHVVVIFFLVFFLLLAGHHIRNRVVEIAGPDPERRRTTATIVDDITEQIQRYLLVLLFTGAVVGVATWLVLAWMGVEHAAMWGVLAGVFNSIPYFGPVIISGGLFIVGIVQGGGVTQALQMAGAAIAITSLEGWLLAPPLMGKAERMSALAVFLGLLLWTWIWGGWGTVLAVPMLVIIKSVADHVEPLKPIGRLLAP